MKAADVTEYFEYFGRQTKTRTRAEPRNVRLNAPTAFALAPDLPRERDLGPVFQKGDNVIHRINHYPVDKC